MGRQATVELPDPLQQESDPAAGAAPNASADDLLAQLAGAEIDRLLADSAQQSAEPAAGPTPIPTAEPEAQLGGRIEPPQQTISNQLDALFQTLNDPQTEDAPAAAEVEPGPTAAELDEQIVSESSRVASHDVRDDARVDARVDARMDARLDASGDGPTIAPTIAPVIDPAATAARELDAPALEKFVISEGAVAADMGADMGADVGADMGDDASAAAVRQALERLDDSVEDQSVPLLFRPLVWLNAPFAAIDPRTRETLGKIAILTMANAAAVLIYVLLFKKH